MSTVWLLSSSSSSSSFLCHRTENSKVFVPSFVRLSGAPYQTLRCLHRPNEVSWLHTLTHLVDAVGGELEHNLFYWGPSQTTNHLSLNWIYCMHSIDPTCPAIDTHTHILHELLNFAAAAAASHWTKFRPHSLQTKQSSAMRVLLSFQKL